MGTVKERNRETVKLAAFPVAAGDNMSPTVSFKKDPNLDVFAKT